MKNPVLFLFLFFLVLTVSAEDPFRTAVLQNGLTVVTFRNTDAPRIMTYIAVRAGSVNDPADSTGLAHYFEHMMFKGTKRIASLDWEKEKPLLDKTAELFEQYRQESDPDKRKNIYAEIDRISGQAAQYANDEYWTLVRQMGATGTNAFTSHEITAYENDIPSNMLDRFLVLEAERFSNIALRRFHTELETVYEEFNRTQDNADRQHFNTAAKLLFGEKSPYGRSVIGLPEHLKNPSIRDVETFFRTYYIPSNMVIILSGDLEHEKALESVKNTFGKLSGTGTIPAIQSAAPLTSPQTAVIHSRESEKLLLAWRFPKNRETDYLFDLMLSVLQNGRCGLLDTNLIQQQKLLSADAAPWGNQFDHILLISAEPKAGQTLEDVRSLILAEIESLKTGKFDPAILKAVANNDRFDLMRMLESRSAAAEIALSLFKQKLTMKDVLDDLQKADTATLQTVADYAAKNLRNEVAVYRKHGEPESIIHAEKPLITPITPGQRPSAFAEELNRIPAGAPPEVAVPDYSRIKRENISPQIYAVPNTVNDRFTLTYYPPGGSLDDPDKAIAHILSYLERIGTEKQSLAEFNKKLYELGLTIQFSCSQNSSGISITGLQKHFPAALDLLIERITQAKPDKKSWQDYIAGIRQERANAKKSPEILTSAALTYALYGSKKENGNPLFHTLTSKELEEEMPPCLLQVKIKSLLEFASGAWFYYGPAPDKATELLTEKNLPVSHHDFARLPDLDSAGQKQISRFQIKPPEENTVYVLPVPGAIQTTAYLIRTDQIAIPAETAFSRLMSRYSGQLFFQELREKQSFGYVAGAAFHIPAIHPHNYAFFLSVIGTQPDKLTAAMTRMLELTGSLPEDNGLFNASKQNVLDQYRSMRIKPEFLFDSRENLRRLSRTADWMKQDFDKLQSMTANDFYRQAQEKLNRSKDLWILSGNIENSADLSKFGKVIFLTADDVLPD